MKDMYDDVIKYLLLQVTGTVCEKGESVYMVPEVHAKKPFFLLT